MSSKKGLRDPGKINKTVKQMSIFVLVPHNWDMQEGMSFVLVQNFVGKNYVKNSELVAGFVLSSQSEPVLMIAYILLNIK